MADKTILFEIPELVRIVKHDDLNMKLEIWREVKDGKNGFETGETRPEWVEEGWYTPNATGMGQCLERVLIIAVCAPVGSERAQVTKTALENAVLRIGTFAERFYPNASA